MNKLKFLVDVTDLEIYFRPAERENVMGDVNNCIFSYNVYGGKTRLLKVGNPTISSSEMEEHPFWGKLCKLPLTAVAARGKYGRDAQYFIKNGKVWWEDNFAMRQHNSKELKQIHA